VTDSIILGIDLGTTACKAVAADAKARLLGIGTGTYPVHTPNPGWTEQNMDEVWRGMVEAVREALAAPGVNASRVRAICFSGALHSLLPIDAAGRPLANAMIWADTRSTKQTGQIAQQTDIAQLYARTGCPPQATMYPLAKLLWLRENRPDIFEAAYKLLSIKDYIIYRMTGRLATEYSIASGTGCMDIARKVWDAEAMGLAQITAQRLPDLLPSLTQIDGLLPEAAEALGLPAGVTVVLGGSDGALANIGAGAVTPGCAALTVGTSGALRFLSPRPLTHPQIKTWCYLVPGGAYLVGGAISNGGLALDWLHDAFGEAEGEQAAAAELPPGAAGLIFLPYFAGERAPYWNADARGVLFGLSLQHRRPHVVRATMEGVAFCLYSVLAALRELDEITEICASGGFIRSRLWLQIFADVLGQEILLPGTREMSAMGAVFTAMLALGMVDTLEETTQFIDFKPGAVPDAARQAVYRDLFAQFESIYRHVVPDFTALAAFRRGHNLNEVAK
jgi:gluconokinase